MRLQHASVGFELGRESEARSFYADAMGLREKPRPIGLKPNPVIWFDAGDGEHEVHLQGATGYVAPERNHLCLEVDDVAATRTQLAAHGVRTREEPEIDGRPRFVAFDPFGNIIEVTQITGRYTPMEG